MRPKYSCCLLIAVVVFASLSSAALAERVAPLPQAELDALRSMSREELLQMVERYHPFMEGVEKAGHRVQEALILLTKDGYSRDEMERLVEVARRGELTRFVVQKLARPLYPSSSTEEERATRDRLLDLLIEASRLPSSGDHSKNRSWRLNAIDGLSRSIRHGLDTEMKARKRGEWPEIPYGNERVIKALLDQLDADGIRPEVFRALRSNLANDPETAELIRSRMRLVENSIVEDDDQKTRRLYHLQRALDECNRDVETLRKEIETARTRYQLAPQTESGPLP